MTEYSNETIFQTLQPIDMISPLVNITTVAQDSNGEPLEGVSAVVLEDTNNYTSSTANGVLFLEDLKHEHSIGFEYQGQQKVFKVLEVPPKIDFTEALDTVYLSNKPKSNFWTNLIIVGCFTGVIITVVKAINEEKPQPITL